ncbi:MAG: lysylphosphatidylglycerol synthase transmembrane domain-containing protein [Acidimicrobiales bacterium]
MATPGSSRRAVAGTTLLGLAIGGVAVALVVRTLLRERRAIGDALATASPGWLTLGVLLAALGMTAIAVPWQHAIRALGDDLPMGQVVARYYVGELGKYLPGGVWPILGRGELARRWGVGRAAAYSSVALSLATLYLSAMLVVSAGLPVLLRGSDDSGPLAVLLLLPLGLSALHPAVLRLAVGLVERLVKRPVGLVIPAWRTSVGLVARYVPAWLTIGLATWAFARALDPSAPVGEVLVAAVLSWVVGFVLVPVPGGIGVREATFVAAAGSLDPGIAATVAVAARLAFVLVDAGGAALGSLALRRRAQPACTDEFT